MEKKAVKRVLKIQELIHTAEQCMNKIYWSSKGDEYSRKCKLVFMDNEFNSGKHVFKVYHAIGKVRLQYTTKSGAKVFCSLSSTTWKEDLEAVASVPEKEYCKLLRAILYCMK